MAFKVVQKKVLLELEYYFLSKKKKKNSWNKVSTEIPTLSNKVWEKLDNAHYGI